MAERQQNFKRTNSFYKYLRRSTKNKKPKKTPPEINPPEEENANVQPVISRRGHNTFSNMSDEELEKLFKKLIEKKGLDYEKCKNLPRAQKEEMLLADSIGTPSTKKLQTPQDYINYLRKKDLRIHKTLNCIRSLRIELANNSVMWIQDFGNTGIDLILSFLRTSYNSNETREDIHSECIKCIRAIMNSKDGLKQIFDHKDALKIVAQTFNPRFPSTMEESVNLLAACCLYPPNGHQKVLEAITSSCENSSVGMLTTGSENRFYPIINGFLLNGETNYRLKTSCLTLTNAIISSPRSLDLRMHLRNEFIRQGLNVAMTELRKNPTDDLQNQIRIFDTDQKEDNEDFIEKFNNIRIDLDSIDKCYEGLKEAVSTTPVEKQLFLSMLQHLLCLRKDKNVRPAYYELIENSISQIVLNENGEDPDFRSKQRFELNVQSVTKDLNELRKLKQELGILHPNMKLSIDNNLVEEKELVTIDNKFDLTPSVPYDDNQPPCSSSKDPLSPSPINGDSQKSCPTSGSNISSGAPPPPPPPPLMPVLDPGVKLPNRSEWKKSDTKKILWKTVEPFNLTPKSFWTHVEENKSYTEDLVKQIETNFKIDKDGTNKKRLSRPDDHQRHSRKSSRSQTITVDSKKERSLLIALATHAKNKSHECIKRSILLCDIKLLTESFLTSLIDHLPNMENVKLLKEKTDNINGLSEIDKFIFAMSDIDRLVPRLKCLLFTYEYPHLINDSRKALKNAIQACKDVRGSKKFHKLLEYILLIGNIMNSGSCKAKAVGFDIRDLPKLQNVKDPNSKMTVVDFIVSNVAQHLPELEDFYSEIASVDKAARNDIEHIMKYIKEIESELGLVGGELESNSNAYSANEGDRFIECMTPFYNVAKTEFSDVRKLKGEMETLYHDLETYFCFDQKKYQLHLFMRDIKTFKDQFKTSQCSMMKLRPAESKICQSKIEPLSTRRQSRVNIAIPESNIIDSLCNSLKTGNMYEREPKESVIIKSITARRRDMFARGMSNESCLNTIFEK